MGVETGKKGKDVEKRTEKRVAKKKNSNILVVFGLVLLFVLGLIFVLYGLGLEHVRIGSAGMNTAKQEEQAKPEDHLVTESAVKDEPKTDEKANGGKTTTSKGIEEPKPEPVDKKPTVDASGTVSKAGENVKLIGPSDGEYASIYPEMKTSAPEERQSFGNTLFLTFDDGPGAGTEQVLDTLKAHGVKATFFVVGNRIGDDTAPLLKRMVDEGHTIGVHTTCHEYKTIYASVEAYLEDFHTTYEKIHDYTGTYPQIFRFPGGSVNSFNKSVYRSIIAEMKARGFTYYDWNISTGDASQGYTPESIVANSLKGLKYKDTGKNAILLAHDTNVTSAAQVDAIITAFENEGFSFAPLSPIVKPVTF